MKVIPEADRQLVVRLPFVAHGDVFLPAVVVENYSLPLKQDGKFIGDQVSKTAFAAKVNELRKEAKRRGKDPFGEISTQQIRKSEWPKLLATSSEAHTLIQVALDDFARKLFDVVQRFRKSDEQWNKVQHIVVGGGFSWGGIGRLAIARLQHFLDDASIKCTTSPISLHPDSAGVCGAAYLSPSWIFAGFDAIVGVDIGGTNIRCGGIVLRKGRNDSAPRTKLVFARRWRHADDDPSRTATLDELTVMLKKVVRDCKREGLKLAPFIGIGCPGRVRPDGTIDRGAQNLPGRWEGENFNLPTLIRDRIVIAKRQETVVVMHNDAVVQGLSEIPRIQNVRDWGILTIGTGLGNAKFTNRRVFD